MPVLQNPKHELFARSIAKGKTQAESYELAGYAPNEKNAARLKANEGVSSRIEELKEKAAKRAEINQAWVLKQLVSNALLAKKLGQIGASTQALALIGKAMPGGMFTERKEVSGPNGTPVQVEASRKRVTLGEMLVGMSEHEGKALIARITGTVAEHE